MNEQQWNASGDFRFGSCQKSQTTSFHLRYTFCRKACWFIPCWVGIVRSILQFLLQALGGIIDIVTSVHRVSSATNSEMQSANSNPSRAFRLWLQKLSWRFSNTPRSRLLAQVAPRICLRCPSRKCAGHGEGLRWPNRSSGRQFPGNQPEMMQLSELNGSPRSGCCTYKGQSKSSWMWTLVLAFPRRMYASTPFGELFEATLGNPTSAQIAYGPMRHGTSLPRASLFTCICADAGAFRRMHQSDYQCGPSSGGGWVDNGRPVWLLCGKVIEP